MASDWWILVPLAFGHTALFVVALNVTHGLGFAERTSAWLKLTLLALFLAGSSVLAYEAWHGWAGVWSGPALAYAAVCAVTGVILVPLCSAYLHLRPRPHGVEGRSAEVDVAGSEGRAGLAGDGPHAWMLRLPGNESLRLTAHDWELQVPGLPAALVGVSLLHLSDLHLSTSYRLRYFEAVMDAAARTEPDLVLFTGDLVDDDASVGWVTPLLGRLHGRLGSFGILGNHDLDHGPADVVRGMEDAGYTVLEGLWTRLSVGGSTLALGGTSFPWGPALDLDRRPEAEFTVVMSHSPDLFYRAERSGVGLMLSGHNHGGQIRLPLLGSVFMPSVYSRRFDRGFFRRGGLTLHVSQGVGANHPVRYGCVPEFTRLVLRALPENPGEFARTVVPRRVTRSERPSGETASVPPG